MSELHAKFEDGAIRWRGTNKAWSFMPFDDAQRLVGQFERDDQPEWFRERAQEFARQLREAMMRYAEWEDSLAA